MNRGQIVAEKLLPLLNLEGHFIHESEVQSLIARAVNEEIELIAKYIEEEDDYGFLADIISHGGYCE